MDRNSIIGIVLICVVLLIFTYTSQPTKEQQEAQKRYADSIELVEKKVKDSLLTVSQKALTPQNQLQAADSMLSDSAKAVAMEQQFGSFASAATGTEQFFTIENDEMKVTLSTKGGTIKGVELKKYKSYYGKPIVLNAGDSTRFSFNFFSQNRAVSTADLYFEPQGTSFTVTGTQQKSFAMRLNAGPGKYLEYQYKLSGTDFMLGYSVNFVNMGEVIAANTSYIELDWRQQLKQFEKDYTQEQNHTTVYYRYTDEEVGNLTETNDAEEDLKTKVQWIGFKQQFFSSVLIAKNNFESPTKISSVASPDTMNLKTLSANFTVPFGHRPAESFDMTFYFGPNHYKTLKKYDLGLEKIVPLGFFGFVNRWAVIPVFNFLNSFNLNYGVIIILLTLFLKIVLLPLTYKSYMSTAKMRVLQPEVAELQEKKKDDPLKLQQEIMQLYRRAGVNPLGGCFPMLLQLPILISMFNFFPSSFELRQEPFLWARDLSTYDSVFMLPFSIPGYGSHVSLFAIFMTISTILYTRMNSSQMPQTGPNAQLMKWMMYLMPIIFLGVMNSYSAGLSYYIFVANMITFGQQWLFKRFVDEKAIHAKIQENKKKPVKKSAFQERLEKMAKERGYKAK